MAEQGDGDLFEIIGNDHLTAIEPCCGFARLQPGDCGAGRGSETEIGVLARLLNESEEIIDRIFVDCYLLYFTSSLDAVGDCSDGWERVGIASGSWLLATNRQPSARS